MIGDRVARDSYACQLPDPRRPALAAVQGLPAYDSSWREAPLVASSWVNFAECRLYNNFHFFFEFPRIPELQHPGEIFPRLKVTFVRLRFYLPSQNNVSKPKIPKRKSTHSISQTRQTIVPERGKKGQQNEESKETRRNGR